MIGCLADPNKNHNMCSGEAISKDFVTKYKQKFHYLPNNFSFLKCDEEGLF